jgi:hypothetical protein
MCEGFWAILKTPGTCLKLVSDTDPDLNSDPNPGSDLDQKMATTIFLYKNFYVASSSNIKKVLLHNVDAHNVTVTGRVYYLT